jgi:hypothetical protein
MVVGYCRVVWLCYGWIYRVVLQAREVGGSGAAARSSLTTPGSALRSVPTGALSSAQVNSILLSPVLTMERAVSHE